MTVLKERAAEREASEFIVVKPIPSLSSITLGLSGAHQQQNATLAVNLARIFLQRHGGVAPPPEETLPEPYVKALERAKWPGRCQTVVDPAHEQTVWFLDGAHTLESLDCCIQWFVGPRTALRTEVA